MILVGVLQPVDIAGYLAFFSGAKYHVDARNAGYFIGFQLGVAAGDDDVRAGVLAGDAANGLPAFLVGQLGHRAGVDDAKVGLFAVAGTAYAFRFERASYGRGLGKIEFAPQRVVGGGLRSERLTVYHRFGMNEVSRYKNSDFAGKWRPFKATFLLFNPYGRFLPAVPGETEPPGLMVEKLSRFSRDGAYGAVGVVLQLAHLHAAQVGVAARGGAVVEEKVPFALVRAYRVVGGPAHDGGENDPGVGKRPVGVVADGVAEHVGRPGGVGEIVLPVILVHPGRFEETVRVAVFQGIAFGVENHDGAGCFGKFEHVVAEASHAGGQCLFVVARYGAALDGLVVAVSLQLAALQPAEVDVVVAVVFKHGRVDAVTAAHGVGLRLEGPVGLVAGGYAEAEDVVLVFGGKVHVVFAVFLGHVARPKLPAGPGNLFERKHDAVVGHLALFGVFGGEYMVVAHVEMVAVGGVGNARLPVVRGVDIDLALEDVSRRVGHVVVGEEVTCRGVERCMVAFFLRRGVRQGGGCRQHDGQCACVFHVMKSFFVFYKDSISSGVDQILTAFRIILL